MTFWLALYGAVLSTVLFIRSVSEGWPRLILHKAGDDIVISLKNEGKHSLVVHGISVLNDRLKIAPSSSPTTLHAMRTVLKESRYGDLQLLVSPQGEQEFRLSVERPARLYICWLIWNSARLRILPRLRLLFVISHRRLDILRRSAQ
jgi:hypothetical protein